MTAEEALLLGLNPVPTRRWLQAGPLKVAFESGDLRYVTFDEQEVIRRVYGAVRDRDWNTVPGIIENLNVEEFGDTFRVEYTSRHEQEKIGFEWRARIDGDADGCIRFLFDGEAKTTFQRNRIGICVLHPVRECAGAPCRARYADGSERDLRFPDVIASEQPVEGFSDLAGFSHEIAPGLWAELEFDGEVFELEDQRNWTDASFKLYCTPLRLEFPVWVQAGTRIRQGVRLKLSGVARRTHSRENRGGFRERDEPVQIVIGKESLPVPSIGLCSASDGASLDDLSLRRLRILRLAHLRVEVRCGRGGLRLAEAGFTEASRIGCAVELVLHLGDAGDEKPVSEFLEALAGRLEETELRVERVLVFGFGCATGTSPAGLALARRYLGRLGALVGGGSNADLYELNNQRPPADVDVVSWSMNPQVHAFDNASIAETPEAAGQQVSSVGVYLPGTPRAVSPVTLKPRLNPVATTGDRQTSPRELPTQVDLRQLSLFGAVWTLAMIKALAEAGVESMTFYETTGWRGVLEPVSGSVLPGNFAWLPGSVFPLYHVFADIAKFARGQVVRTRSSRPSEIASLYLRAGDRRRLIVANLSPAPHELELPEFEETPRARTLDASTGLAAITAPEEFRSQSEPLRGSRYEIAPYGLLTLDFSGN